MLLHDLLFDTAGRLVAPVIVMTNTPPAAAAADRSTYRARQQSSSINPNHSGPRPILNWLSKKLLHPTRNISSGGTDATASTPTFSVPSRDDARERQAAAASSRAAAVKQRRATIQGRAVSEVEIVRSTAHPTNLQGRNRNTLSLTPKNKHAAASAQGSALAGRVSLRPAGSGPTPAASPLPKTPSSQGSPNPVPILNRSFPLAPGVRHAASPTAGPSNHSSRKKASSGSLASATSSKLVSPSPKNIIDLTPNTMHPLSRAFTFETRTSASPSLSSSSRFDLETGQQVRSEDAGYGSEDSFPQRRREERRHRRMGSGASSIDRASSFLDPLDPDGDARSWVPSVASASPVRGRQRFGDTMGAEGIFLGNSGPPSRRPASFASMASASTSAAVRKMRRSSSLWDDELGFRVRAADDDASLRPLPPSHASSIRLRPVPSAEDTHVDETGGGSLASLHGSPGGKTVAVDAESLMSLPGGPKRRDTGETLDPGSASRHRSEEGLHADFRGAKTASLMVLRPSSRSSRRSARSGQSAASSGSISDDHDDASNAGSKTWQSDDGLSRVSTKPTTVFSTDSNNWVAGQALHLPLAHIAQAQDLDEQAMSSGDTDEHDAEMAFSTADAILRPSPRSPSHGAMRSGTIRPPSGEYGPPSAHLSQAPRHNAPHPRDNPRPHSPPNDDASVITLASSNCPPRNRGGTSIRTYGTAPSVFGDSVGGGPRDSDTASVAAAPGGPRTRSIAGSIHTWPEIREVSGGSGEDTMHRLQSAAQVGLGPPVSTGSIRGFQEDNASLVALRGRRNSNGSLGSKFSYIPPSQMPAAA